MPGIIPLTVGNELDKGSYILVCPARHTNCPSPFVLTALDDLVRSLNRVHDALTILA